MAAEEAKKTQFGDLLGGGGGGGGGDEGVFAAFDDQQTEMGMFLATFGGKHTLQSHLR